ncbi:MAG TPA: tetratricopeptide repeat protein [Candidatus Obscuribacterales bacterium]
MIRMGKTAASVLCLTQVFLLTIGSGSFAFAYAAPAVQKRDEERLARFESVLLGALKKGREFESRLRAIETNVFGEAKSGSYDARLDALDKVIANGKSELLAPPIPPQLDTRQWSKVQEADNYIADSEPVREATHEDKAQSILRRATEAYGQGRTAEAEHLFKEVIRIDRNNADAHFNLGAIAEGRGDLDAALRSYKAANQANPRDAEIREALSSVERKVAEKERTQLADRQRQQAEAAEADRRERLKAMVGEASQAYKNKQYDAAARKLEQVLREAPNDPDVHFALAQALKAKGETARARQHLSQALAAQPGNQLYKDAMADLDQKVASARSQDSSPSYPRSSPPEAPSRGGISDEYQTSGFQPMSPGFQAMDNEPLGSLTPFTSDGSLRGSRRGGPVFEIGGTGGMGSMAGLGALGGLAGMAGMGGMRGMRGIPGDGFTSSSALKRAAVGGLAGAVVGGLMGSRKAGGGGVKRGAIRGAVVGGALGLMSGGF